MLLCCCYSVATMLLFCCHSAAIPIMLLCYSATILRDSIASLLLFCCYYYKQVLDPSITADVFAINTGSPKWC